MNDDYFIKYINRKQAELEEQILEQENRIADLENQDHVLLSRLQKNEASGNHEEDLFAPNALERNSTLRTQKQFEKRIAEDTVHLKQLRILVQKQKEELRILQRASQQYKEVIVQQRESKDEAEQKRIGYSDLKGIPLPNEGMQAELTYLSQLIPLDPTRAWMEMQHFCKQQGMTSIQKETRQPAQKNIETEMTVTDKTVTDRERLLFYLVNDLRKLLEEHGEKDKKFSFSVTEETEQIILTVKNNGSGFAFLKEHKQPLKYHEIEKVVSDQGGTISLRKERQQIVCRIVLPEKK